MNLVAAEPVVNNDFIIRYNSYEIPASKCLFALYSERFRKVQNSLSTQEFQINDTVPNHIFEEFIKGAQGLPAKITTDSAFDLLHLCSEWEVENFRKEVLKFIRNNPDLEKAADVIMQSNKWESTPELEMILSENLDSAIQIPSFGDFPLSTLERIINRKERVISNMHLLCQFVLKMLEKHHEQASVLASQIDIRLLNPNEAKELLQCPYLNKSILGDNLAETTLTLLSEKNDIQKKYDELSSRLDMIIQKVDQMSKHPASDERILQLENRVNQMHQSFQTQLETQISQLASQTDQQIRESENKAHKDLRRTNSTVNSLTRKTGSMETKLTQLEQRSQEADRSMILLRQKTNDIERRLSHADLPTTVEIQEEKFLFKGQPLQGIISYLTKVGHGNVNSTHLIEITASSSDHNSPFQVADIGWKDLWFTLDRPNQWIQFDFLNKEVSLTNYTIKTHKYPSLQCHLKSWVVEGSCDGSAWTEIDKRSTNVLNGPNRIQTFPATYSDGWFRYIRLRQVGPNFRGDNILAFTNIEFFGSLSAEG